MKQFTGKAQGDLFSPRTLFWLFAIGISSFLIALSILIFADDQNRSGRAAAHPYSDSAIGHRVFVEYLKELGISTILSRDPILGRDESDSVLVLLEPPTTNLGADDVLQLFADERAILLVLPKWDGEADPENPGFLAKAWLKPASGIDRLLRLLDTDIGIIRRQNTQSWVQNDLGVVPSFTQPQLIRSDEIEAIIRSENGILFGRSEFSGRDIFVLSDPDILNNHGIDEGQNHILVARMMDYIRGEEGAVFVDATLHGFVQSQNLWRRVFEFPFVIVTMCAFATLLIYLWAASPRFGGPKRHVQRLQPGKSGLIENTASLLDRHGSQALVLRDYFDLTLEQVRARLHLGTQLSSKDLARRLDKIGASRGVEERYSDLRVTLNAQISSLNVEGAAGQNLARRLHFWRRDILQKRRADRPEYEKKPD